MTNPSQLHYDCQPDGLMIRFLDGQMMLSPYSEQIVRVRFTRQPAFSTRKSLIVDIPLPRLDYTIKEAEDHLDFSTGEISILINKVTAAFTYQDKAGGLLTKEPDRGGKTLVPIDVVKTVFDENVQIQTAEGVDGLRTSITGLRNVIDRRAYHSKLEFEWAEDEALYGLGSHEEGMFNLRGQCQYLYQHNMKAVVPVLVSTRGYGILIDNCSLMKFHDDAEGSFLWSDVADELDYYFILGPEFDQIVQGIRHLTGKAPMLPKWSFGYIQSKERYQTQDELISIVSEYRQRKLPLDCIVLDWHSWPDGLWGQKSFDLKRFPNPKKMMDTIHDLNAHLMISIWPIMSPNGKDWQEMRQNGLLLGNQATYNAFLPEAQQLYWEQARCGLFSQGIDAWWCDCTEPFEADWKDALKPESEDRLEINVSEAKKYLDPEYINAFSLVHSKGIYEGQRKTSTDKRVINLTRSAYAGQHRYGTITWSGDISASWKTLRNQIPEGMNFCVTGAPYWTLDIGGYFVKNKPKLWFWSGDYEDGLDDLGYRELYVRWFQYASFLPIFRAHGTDIDREIWCFGDPGTPFYDAMVKFLRFRYRLMPYIYSVAGMVTLEDYTPMRALAFDFRQDPKTYNIADQFMFGPALMVCPVTQPMYYAAGSEPLDYVEKVRSVYLPAGSNWYDYWTDEFYKGGQTITAQAPLDRIPLYVRAGSIIPMGTDIQYSDEQSHAPLGLQIYPGQDGHFALYEDEGDNYNYEQGAFTKIPIRWQEDHQHLVIDNRQGSFPGMIDNRKFQITIISNKNDIDEISLQLDILYAGQSLTIELKT